MGQYPAPVVCLRRMYDRKVAGINELEMTSQVEKFCKEITTVLEHKMSELFTKFCEIVYYEGMLSIFFFSVVVSSNLLLTCIASRRLLVYNKNIFKKIIMYVKNGNYWSTRCHNGLENWYYFVFRQERVTIWRVGKTDRFALNWSPNGFKRNILWSIPLKYICNSYAFDSANVYQVSCEEFHFIVNIV